MDLRQSLAGKLTKKEMQFLRTSYDVIGSIAVIEVPKELKKKPDRGEWQPILMLPARSG